MARSDRRSLIVEADDPSRPPIAPPPQRRGRSGQTVDCPAIPWQSMTLAVLFWIPHYCVMRTTLSRKIDDRGGAMDTTQVLKGVLDTAVLAVLTKGNTYGYDLVRQLREAGLDDVGDASVYGTLRRLFSNGYLTSEIVPSDEGPARKYYGINKAGNDLLVRSHKTWKHLSGVLNDLLEDVA